MSFKNKLKYTLGTFALIAGLSGVAQDTHYWTQQYGTKSSLLGGAAIGGVRDNSGIYYNPGAIGFIENKNLSISANAYQADRINIRNGAGDGINLVSNSVQTMPLIISGLFKLDEYPRHTLGYGLLTKNQFNLNTNARSEGSKNLISDNHAVGMEDYTDQFNLKSSIYETMAGWAYAYKISDKLSVGIGNYGIYRSNHNDYDRSVRVIPTDSNLILREISIYDRSYSISIMNVRTIFKGGISLNLDTWKFGLTITSPSINIWSSGIIQSDETVANLDYFNSGFLISFTGNDRQAKLKNVYKTPLSIGFGTEYGTENTVFAFSCEWFDMVKEYDVMKAKPGAYLRPAQLNFATADEVLTISEARKSVFNFAVGWQQKLTSDYYGSIAFRTNNSYSKQNKLPELSLTYTNWDIYHFSIGATKKREKSDLSVALNFALGGTKNVYQYANLTNIDVSNAYEGVPEKTTALFSSFAVMIGYTHRLK